MEYSRVCHDYVMEPGIAYNAPQAQVQTYHAVEPTVIQGGAPNFNVQQSGPAYPAPRPVSYQTIAVYHQPVQNNVQYVWSQQPTQSYAWVEQDVNTHRPGEMPYPKRFRQDQKTFHRNMECKKKIGIYTRAERNRRLEKYRQRRRERNYDAKKVRYEIRKTISQRRARSKGRFTKRSEREDSKDDGNRSS